MNRATMGEGNTPLIPSVTEPGLWFKLETCNPSGSYKDRFIAAEMTRMLEAGARTCVATSSGNTGASLAAYSARYGVRCVILVNHDAPSGKLAQMQAHGARLIRVRDFASDPAVTACVFAALRAFSERNGAPLVVSAFRYCPEGMRGVEAISREISAARMPDHVFVPVGGGGLYSAVVQGFQESGRVPRVHAVQPKGCLTVVASFLRGDTTIREVTSTTRVSGLSVPFDIDAARALTRLGECGGTGVSVSDEEVFAAQRFLFEREGIYTEPAGAAALAGWLKARQEGWIGESETSVCLVTGHGFKDPASVEAAASAHPALSAEAGDVAQLLESLLEKGNG